LHSLTLQDEQNEIEKGVGNCEKTVKENHEKIQADLALRDDGGERARNEARLQVLEAGLNEWALKEHDAEQGVQIANNDLKAKDNQERDAKRACDTARSNVATLNNTHTQLKGTSESSMKAYHDRMPSVLEEIQKRRGVFKEMPIGPLGAFVKIKKEQWSQICENVFGRSLNGFLVSNYQDLERLREILKAKAWYPQQGYDLTKW
jgi:chromosome segregation ATPase